MQSAPGLHLKGFVVPKNPAHVHADKLLGHHQVSSLPNALGIRHAAGSSCLLCLSLYELHISN